MEATAAPKPKRAPRSKKDVSVPVPATPALFIEELSGAATPPAPPAKKKTAKPVVVAKVTPGGIIGQLGGTEQRPLIAHLPVQLSEIESDLFGGGGGGGSSEPCPFSEDSMLAPVPATVDETQATTVMSVRPSLPLNYTERLMIRYTDANREQRLPETTDVACWWDAHPFRGRPCVIPLKIQEDIWHVYGNFCCAECAAAYLFAERLDAHVQWERYALLNRLYGEGQKEGVRLAPARTVLRLFGGMLDVSEYRALVSEGRMRLDVMMPPMISITQVMDTKPIDFYDASVKNNFIPWEMDRMNRPGAQGLRLRRTKPVAEKEATLEGCMGIVMGGQKVTA
jgi:hypothetical protein